MHSDGAGSVRVVEKWHWRSLVGNSATGRDLDVVARATSRSVIRGGWVSQHGGRAILARGQRYRNGGARGCRGVPPPPMVFGPLLVITCRRLKMRSRSRIQGPVFAPSLQPL